MKRKLSNVPIHLKILEHRKRKQSQKHKKRAPKIYKKAIKKAKEIRQNAIEAFLEAKNIKNRYNLTELENSSDSENEDNDFLNIS